MPSTKNFRHARLRVLSGDSTPLEFIVDLDDGNFQWEEGRPVNIVKSRGRNREVTRGDEQPMSWQFSAMFVDKRLYRVIRDFVWPDQTAVITGLTALAANDAEPITGGYAYEQGSLLVTVPASGMTKGAVDSAADASGEYSEDAGEEDVEGVIRATTFSIYPPAATTSVTVTFDAVGQGTAGAASDICQGGVKTYNLVLDIYDPCFPPDPDDASAGTVVERYQITDAFQESVQFQEGEEADKVTFSGRSIVAKVAITTV